MTPEIRPCLQSEFTITLTSAYPIQNPFSHPAGGDASLSTVTTLPNIIREYNNDLYGYSEGTTIAQPSISPNTQFNVGHINAHAIDMLTQAETLVNRTRNDLNVSFETDWKVVTIFVGFNDLCDYPCINDPQGDPDVWIENYAAALDYLRDNMPRTFVNVVQLADLFSLHEAAANHPTLSNVCRFGLRQICRCSRYGVNFTSEEEFRRFNNEYKTKLVELISGDRYRTKDDFTVELQLFFDEFNLTTFGESNNENVDPVMNLLASDCLHLSSKGNRLMAVALWNNMLQPTEDKQTTLFDNDRILCPTNERSFFATSHNISGSDFSCDTSVYDGIPPAKTVRELKPTDIRVIGAMGDSLTSGFGALTEPQNLPDFTDYRGLVWSVGKVKLRFTFFQNSLKS